MGFKSKIIVGTDPTFINAAFTPYKPSVKTRWDANYFYVESLGIPAHQTMVGITSWQQQFPIPQCYVGTNAWSIPLNPVLAVTPVSTKTNFFTCAIGLAANGIPIFNAFNNRGVDSYLIGELDKFGGHCGKADDYHYHTAPLSLDSTRATVLPIAFALDGFAVYGSKEPDGTAMKTLDANHGHYGANNVYHYHGTLVYPYMVGNMVGVVTKDNGDQIIPQAQTTPVRAAGLPLNGASITDMKVNGSNGFNLTYLLNNQNYNVNYSWTVAGVLTFNYVNPTGTTTQTFTNFKSCALTTPTLDLLNEANSVNIFPNPTRNGFSIGLVSPLNTNDIQNISIFDVQGRLIFSSSKFIPYIETKNWQSGTYFMQVKSLDFQVTKKIVVE